MSESLTIPSRFNGPPGSANGGYTCGVVAALIGTEEASVSLRLPPPVDRPLSVVRDGMFAAGWTPDRSLDDGGGHVRTECVWAALDCPTSAPVANFADGPPMVLARLTARLGGSVVVGERHSILSWRVAVDGRKRHGACALFDSAGRLLATSQALWIEVRPE